MRISSINTSNNYKSKLQSSCNTLITEPTIKRGNYTSSTSFTAAPSLYAASTEEIVAAKKIFKEAFLDLVEKEKAGEQVLIPNSIVIHGKSMASKARLYNFLVWEIKTGFDKISFDINKPNVIMGLLHKSAVKAENMFKQTKQRTVLQISKLDDLFADKSPEGLLRVDKFKDMTKDFSEKFHTTLLLKIDKNLDSAENVAKDDFFKLKLKLDENPAEIPKPEPEAVRDLNNSAYGDGIATYAALDRLNHYMKMENFDYTWKMLRDGVGG